MNETPVKACGACGAGIELRAEFCPKCGARQAAQPPAAGGGKTAPNGKSRIAAALLAFFLGGFGGHKFYLGQIGYGVLYLAFCWTLIPGLVSLIEFILLLTMSDEKFARKYGQVRS